MTGVSVVGAQAVIPFFLSWVWTRRVESELFNSLFPWIVRPVHLPEHLPVCVCVCVCVSVCV